MREEDLFDRSLISFAPLVERHNKVRIRDAAVSPDSPVPKLEGNVAEAVDRCAEAVVTARAKGKPVICAFGAHSIKNGLGPLIADLVEHGFLTHLATNGAGVIHDWEFAMQGESSEDVRANAAQGLFGIWEETGLSINAAILVGAYRGLGYGESVGRFIADDGVLVPEPGELIAAALEGASRGGPGESLETVERAAAALDILVALGRSPLKSGMLKVGHPFRDYSLQYRALKANVPFTAHPMFGHDIIYTHPTNTGAAIGRAAERDFLRYAKSISGIGDGGVYLSVGSAVMSPMVFEKSYSMSNNLAIAAGKAISGHRIFVVDIQEGDWDWRKGEPPVDNPAYYHRFMKTFSRMGGEVEYLCVDNRDFFLALRAGILAKTAAGGDQR